MVGAFGPTVVELVSTLDPVVAELVDAVRPPVVEPRAESAWAISSAKLSSVGQLILTSCIMVAVKEKPASMQ